MPEYRFFFVTIDGIPTRGTAFQSRDDETAIEVATDAARGDRAELWNGERLVWCHPPDDA